MDLSNCTGLVTIIPAAGTGSRMNLEIPKQYLKINQQAILDITLSKFLTFKAVELIVLVVSPHDEHYKQLENIQNKKVKVIFGGKERIHSVNNALIFLKENKLPSSIPIMVHDAARPCITHGDLNKMMQVFQKKSSACLLAAPVVDTLQLVDENNQVKRVVDRTHLVRALTPQMACFGILNTAISTAIKNQNLATDEVSALTVINQKVEVVIGRSDNIKITHPEDLKMAELFLK